MRSQFVFFFFKPETACELDGWLEFRRVLFRSHRLEHLARAILRLLRASKCEIKGDNRNREQHHRPTILCGCERSEKEIGRAPGREEEQITGAAVPSKKQQLGKYADCRGGRTGW